MRQLSEERAPADPQDLALRLRLEAEKEALAVQLADAQASVLGATQAQHAAEAHVASLQQEVAHLQHSLQAASARGPPQLEQQLSELQELLYQKQQQLERLSGEKQAQLMMLERQVCGPPGIGPLANSVDVRVFCIAGALPVGQLITVQALFWLCTTATSHWVTIMQ